MMNNKSLFWIMFLPTTVLLVPLTAMQFTTEVNWDVIDFAVAWFLMAGFGFAYTVIANRLAHAPGDANYRAGVGVALGTAFVLIWMNLAVGLIGSEDNPANLLYLAVFGVGAIGALIARFEPEGMARTLATTAIVQALVPLFAVAIWKPTFTWDMIGVFGLNAFFAALFVASALLFERAAPHGLPQAN